jgi:hypothetical protein
MYPYHIKMTEVYILMQSPFALDISKQLRPVSLGKRSGGSATLAPVLPMEQTLSAP